MGTLKLKLAGERLPAIVRGPNIRVTDLDTNQAVSLPSAIERELDWYAVTAESTHQVPRSRIRVEAFHGIETDIVSEEIDLTESESVELTLELKNFYDPKAYHQVAGNTHLHLMKMSYESALDYLKTVPASDGLEVVFLSHLRRIPDERTYISNLIVEQDFQTQLLTQLSTQDLVFGNGEEHRHNFDAHNEGFGHVMLLNLQQLVKPVSIGPGIMKSGYDSVPLQTGIRETQHADGTVVWCHNHWGREDIPNWLAGLIDAQNIFDGGSQGSYEDSFYRYLNLGLQVPFSAGTDWFIYDFSRVYVPLREKITVDAWLEQLRAGRSYITNGTMLEFQVDDSQIGDTIAVDQAKAVTVIGRAIGRDDFGSVEVVSAGEVIQTAPSKKVDGHFEADINMEFLVDKPGWLALRIPRNQGKNVFEKELFAHTSPIYLEFAGEQVFVPSIAEQMIEEMEQSISSIRSLAVFENEQSAPVLDVYRNAIADLQERLAAASK